MDDGGVIFLVPRLTLIETSHRPDGRTFCGQPTLRAYVSAEAAFDHIGHSLSWYHT